jgi:hypothetical protein
MKQTDVKQPRYQFQIIDHGFLQAHFKAKQSPKKHQRKYWNVYT